MITRVGDIESCAIYSNVTRIIKSSRPISTPVKGEIRLTISGETLPVDSIC